LDYLWPASVRPESAQTGLTEPGYKADMPQRN
jgi:hypothetical protein